jgi:Bacterial Ig-like domain (group 2)
MTSDAPTRIRRLAGALALLMTALACGGASGNASAPPAPPEGAPRVASISLSPSTARMTPGSSRQFSAQPVDAAGNALPQVTPIWSSSAPTVASVSASGLVSAIAPGSVVISASAGGVSSSAQVTVEAQYDLEALGVPRIVVADYIELHKVARISRFRSGIGHDYVDDVERCRSMKHYFQPYGSVDWGSVVIRSPMDGVIRAILDETTFGKQVQLTSRHIPAATVIIFHVRLDSGIAVGAPIAAGSRLGTHIGNATMSDIAILVDTPRGRRLVSYAEATTDSVFAGYQARGVASRTALQVSAAERDANPLTCNGETFAGSGVLANWVELR